MPCLWLGVSTTTHKINKFSTVYTSLGHQLQRQTQLPGQTLLYTAHTLAPQNARKTSRAESSSSSMRERDHILDNIQKCPLDLSDMELILLKTYRKRMSIQVKWSFPETNVTMRMYILLGICRNLVKDSVGTQVTEQGLQSNSLDCNLQRGPYIYLVCTQREAIGFRNKLESVRYKQRETLFICLSSFIHLPILYSFAYL